MRPITKVLALAGLIVGIGGDATAQRPGGRGPRGPGGPDVSLPRRGGAGVTAMLNARRSLELTPRQVAQLDSIERVLHAERKQFEAQVRPMADSMRARMRRDGAPRDSAQRAQWRADAERRQATLRPQMERLRQRDSAATVAAERLLNDAQRTQWRELQAERRGFVRGMQAGQGRGAGGGRPGMRGMQPDMRPGMRREARPDGPPGRPGAPGQPMAPRGQRPLGEV